MKKTWIILSLFAVFNFSCSDDHDTIYLSHKLILEIEKVSDYRIGFAWNTEVLDRYSRLLLVETFEEKEIEFYEEIIHFFIEGNSVEYPEWYNECNFYFVPINGSDYEFYYYWEHNLHYFKLIAYNARGEYIYSNTAIF